MCLPPERNAEMPKPNLLPLTNQNISTQFTTSQVFGTTTYLTSTGVSEVDAHMMKNTEWGAVTYLTLSKYGINKIVKLIVFEILNCLNKGILSNSFSN